MYNDSIDIFYENENKEFVKYDENGKPYTAHTTNPVPLILTSNKYELKEHGILSDIAPTMLELLGVAKPSDMTSESLIIKK